MTAAGYAANRQPTLLFTYDRTTMRATLGMTDIKTGDTFTFTLRWTAADILAPYAGFEYKANSVLRYNTAGVDTSTNITSPNCVNVNPVTALYLRSDTLAQTSNNKERLVEPYTTPATILGVVPVTTSPSTWLQYASGGGDAVRVRLASADVKTIQLYFTSLTYDAETFDGVNWRVCLQFRELRSPMMARVAEEDRQARIALAQQMTQLTLKRAALTQQATEQVRKIRQRLTPPGSESATA